LDFKCDTPVGSKQIPRQTGFFDIIHCMKKNPHTIRTELDRLVSERNARLAARCIAKAGKAEEFILIREETDYLIGELLKRKADIDAGRLFQPMWPYDMDNVARIFATVTRLTFDGWAYDKSLSDERLAQLGQMALSRTAPLATFSKEFDMRIALVTAYIDYVRSAASLAKHLQSPTARIWAKMLLELDTVLNGAKHGYALGADITESKQLCDLQRPAADELRIDITLAGIPSFNPAKAVKKTVTAKRGARNGL